MHDPTVGKSTADSVLTPTPFWALVLSLFLLGCNTTTEQANDTPVQRVDQLETTLGSYGQGRESRLLLVTLDAPAHRALVNDQPIISTDPSAADLPPLYGQFLDRLQQRYGITRVADWPLASLGIRCLVFESNGDRSVAELTRLLAAEDNVETAQAMQLFDVQQSPYNDPFMPLQHGFQSMQTRQSHDWASGSGVRVAIVDTGVDLTHPDLSSTSTMSRNFVDTNQDAFHADKHGTAIAGVIAAATNNDIGMAGIAPDASLMALKACWQLDTKGSSAHCNSYTLAKALNFSIQNEAHVINLSLAGPRDPLLERLVREAMNQNIIVVGAVGPDGINRFPTAVPGTVAVVADETASVRTVSAPGRKILSTQPFNEYEFVDGSSFSAAHISGLAALARELDASSTPADFSELLRLGADPVSGTINACRTLASLQDKTGVDCSFE